MQPTAQDLINALQQQRDTANNQVAEMASRLASAQRRITELEQTIAKMNVKDVPCPPLPEAVNDTDANGHAVN